MRGPRVDTALSRLERLRPSSEVVDVEVAAPLPGKRQRRTVAVLDPVERVECPRLQRHRSHARFRFRDPQLAPSEGAPHVDHTLLARVASKRKPGDSFIRHAAISCELSSPILRSPKTAVALLRR